MYVPVCTFTEEIPTIKRKFLKDDYSHRFVKSAIKEFNEKSNGITQDDYIIMSYLFVILKTLILAKIPYCPRNKTLSKRFIKKCQQNSLKDLPTTHIKLK